MITEAQHVPSHNFCKLLNCMDLVLRHLKGDTRFILSVFAHHKMKCGGMTTVGDFLWFFVVVWVSFLCLFLFFWWWLFWGLFIGVFLNMLYMSV